MADRVNKKRRKKARAALLAFLKNLEKKCVTFASADEWYKNIKDFLKPVITEFNDVIPRDYQEKLDKASKLTDTSREAINNSCRHLQKEVQNLIKFLPAGGIFASPLLATVIIGAVVVGTSAALLNSIAVTVKIKNNGCDTIYPVLYLPVKIPGLVLPDQPIVDGGEGTAKVPPFKFTVNLISGNRIELRSLNMNFSFDLSSSAIALVFDGQSLSGQTDLDLAGRKVHTLDINCS